MMSPQMYAEHTIDFQPPSVTVTLNFRASNYPCTQFHMLTSIKLLNYMDLSL